MKLLCMRGYYPPEQTAGMHLDNDFNEKLENSRINITYITPTPTRSVSPEIKAEYRNKLLETTNNGYVTVKRFKMFDEKHNPLQRAARYACCNILEYFKGIQETETDIVYSSSTPPTQGMLSALVARKLTKKKKKKVPLLFNLQDIFPDSLVNANMTRKGSIIWKIGRKIEDFTYRSADKIIVISEGFKQNIVEKGVPEEKIVVIPNWVDANTVRPIAREDNVLFDRYHLARDKFYVCYSGNIGHSQNLELLIEVATLMRSSLPDVSFVLIGEGAAKEELEKRIAEEKLDNIIMLPFQPYEEISHVFSLGDAGLIISKPGIGGSSVPSKTWSIMAAEKPIIASFDEESELTALVQENRFGIAAGAGDAEKLCDAVRCLYENRELGRDMGRRARQYVCEYLDKDTCTGMYIEALRATMVEGTKA